VNPLLHGPLAPLFDDPRVTEILVNGPDAVYAEIGGRLQRADLQFRDDVELRQAVVRLVGLCGRRIDDATPLVDARLPDGSRLNAVLPPLAVDGPLLTVRRFGVRRLGIDDLLRLGSLSKLQAAALRTIVDARLNVVVSGGTFQNLRLLASTRRLLEQEGLRVLDHRLVPPNDAGISYGQAAVAAAKGVGIGVVELARIGKDRM